MQKHLKLSFILLGLISVLSITSCRKKESCAKWDAQLSRRSFVVFMKDGLVLPDSIGKQYRFFTVYKGDTVTNPFMIDVLDGKMPFPGDETAKYMHHADEYQGNPPGTKPGLFQLHYLAVDYNHKGINTYYLQDTISGKMYEVKVTAAYYDDPCEAKKQTCYCANPLRSFSFEGVQLHSDTTLARIYDINTPMFEIYRLDVE